MHLPKAKNEVNVNTIIQIVGFLLVIGGMGATWGSAEENRRYIGEKQAASDARVTSVESQIARVPNLEYRITVLEQANLSTTKALDDLRTAVNTQGADIRVIREILTRLDGQIARSNAE